MAEQIKIINGVPHRLVDVKPEDIPREDENPEKVTGEIRSDYDIPRTKIINGVKHKLVDVPDDAIPREDRNPEGVTGEVRAGGYNPEPETVLNKAIPQTMTGDEITNSTETDFIRQQELRGYDPFKESVRNVASFVTFDNQDEIEAGIRSAFGADYEKTRDQLRQQLTNYQVENGATSIVMGIAGGILSGVGAVSALSKFPKAYKLIMGAPGSTWGQKAKRLIYGGAGAGALTGTGVAPEKEDIISPMTGFYTAGGALASPLMAGGIKGASVIAGSAWNAVKNLMTSTSLKNADQEVIQRIALQLEKQGYNAQQIEEEILKQQRAGIEAPQFAETSARSLTDDARRAMSVPSKSDEEIIDTLTTRVSKLPKAMVTKLKGLFNLDDVELSSKYLDDIVEEQSRKAKLKFPEADAVKIPLNKFKININGEDVDLVNSNFFKSFYNKARKEFNNTNVEQLPSLEVLLKNKNMSTNMAKKIKRMMQKEIDLEKRRGNNDVFAENGLADIKNKFNKIIESNNPQFKQANKEFADSARLQEIYEQGQKYNNLDDPALEKLISSFDEDQLKVFKTGMLNTVNTQAEKYTGGNFTTKIFGSERQKNTFKRIMNLSGKDYKEFEDIAKFSRNRMNKKNDILGGSQTNTRGLSDANAIPIGQGGMIPQIVQYINTMAQKTQIAPVVAESMKKKLLNATPAEQQAIIKQLKAIEASGGVKTAGTRISNVVNNPVSQQMSDIAPSSIFNLITQTGLLDDEDTQQPMVMPYPDNIYNIIGVAGENANKTRIRSKREGGGGLL